MSPETLKRCRGRTYPEWPDGTRATYAMDNGAWTAHQKGIPFDSAAFLWALDRIGEQADWIVMPDCVGDAAQTLEMAAEWWPRLRRFDRVLFAVQDGMEVCDVEPWVRRGCGLFVGGSTDWKLRTLALWSSVAHRSDQWCHVGRVNSIRRFRMCLDAGIDSVDGSGVAQFPSTLDRLVATLKQPSLLGGIYEGSCTV